MLDASICILYSRSGINQKYQDFPCQILHKSSIQYMWDIEYGIYGKWTDRTNTPNTLNMVGKEKMSKVGQSECDAIITHRFF